MVATEDPQDPMGSLLGGVQGAIDLTRSHLQKMLARIQTFPHVSLVSHDFIKRQLDKLYTPIKLLIDKSQTFPNGLAMTRFCPQVEQRILSTIDNLYP